MELCVLSFWEREKVKKSERDPFSERLLKTGQLGKTYLRAGRNSDRFSYCYRQEGKKREEQEVSKGRSPLLLACCPGCESTCVPSQVGQILQACRLQTLPQRCCRKSSGMCHGSAISQEVASDHLHLQVAVGRGWGFSSGKACKVTFWGECRSFGGDGVGGTRGPMSVGW